MHQRERVDQVVARARGWGTIRLGQPVVGLARLGQWGVAGLALLPQTLLLLLVALVALGGAP